MNRKARMFCGWLLALWGLSLVLPLWASAADDELKQGDWVIALSNSYYGNTWRKQMVEVFEAAAEEAKARGYIKDYIVLNGDGSINTQVAHMNSLILRNVDAIAINAASPTALNGVIEEAHRAGIKVLAFDSIVTSPYAWKLDFDFVALGEAAARYAVERLNGRGNVIIVRGVSGSAPDLEMYKGQMNVLSQYPDINIVATVYGEASATVTQRAIANILPGLPRIDAVIQQGGGDSYGAAQAFEAAGREIPIIIGDGSAEFIQWWLQKQRENGYETYSISSSPGIGAAAVWLLVAILNGLDVPQEMRQALTEVTRDNVHEYADLAPGTIVSPVYTWDYVLENIIRPYRSQ